MNDRHYFNNCRGVDFTPVYDSIWWESGHVPTTTSSFSGITPTMNSDELKFNGATYISTWAHFREKDIIQQINLLKKSGVNLLRVHLDLFAWAALGDKFISRIKKLARIAQDKKIYLQWVLFESDTPNDTSGLDSTARLHAAGGKDPSSLYDAMASGLVGFQRCPTIFQHSLVTRSPSSMETSGNYYFEDVVEAVSSYKSTLNWEVMSNIDFNSTENPSDVSAYSFVTSAITKLKQLIPDNQKVTCSFKYLTGDTKNIKFSQEKINICSSLDFICYKFNESVGPFKKYYNYLQAMVAASISNKPLLPINAGDYSELNSLKSDISDLSSLNMGFIADSIVDRNLSNKYKNDSKGLIFVDGQVRSKEDSTKLKEITKDIISKIKDSSNKFFNKILFSDFQQKFDFYSKQLQISDYGPYTSQEYSALGLFKRWENRFSVSETSSAWYEIRNSILESRNSSSIVDLNLDTIGTNFAPFASNPLSKKQGLAYESNANYLELNDLILGQNSTFLNNVLNYFFDPFNLLSNEYRLFFSFDAINQIWNLLNPSFPNAYSDYTRNKLVYYKIKLLEKLQEALPIQELEGITVGQEPLGYPVNLLDPGTRNLILQSYYPFAPSSSWKLESSSVVPYVSDPTLFKGFMGGLNLSAANKPVCFYSRDAGHPSGACYYKSGVGVIPEFSSTQDVFNDCIDWKKYDDELTTWFLRISLGFAECTNSFENYYLLVKQIESDLYGDVSVNIQPISNGIEVYPGPGVETLRSGMYSVEVYDPDVYTYSSCYVYSATDKAQAQSRTDYTSGDLANDPYRNKFWKNGDYPVMNWTTFGTSSTTRVKVSCKNSSIDSVEIRPKSKNIAHEIINGSLYMDLNPLDNVWLKINNNTSSFLFVFANPPKPPIPESRCSYFGPGIHYLSAISDPVTVTGNFYWSSFSSTYISTNPQLSAYDGQSYSHTFYGQFWSSLSGYEDGLDYTIYIDGGAYVIGGIDLRTKNNIKIIGPGILSNENLVLSNYQIDQANPEPSGLALFSNGIPLTAAIMCNLALFRYEGPVERTPSGMLVSGITITRQSTDSIVGANIIHDVKFISPWHYLGGAPWVIADRTTKVGSITHSFIFTNDESPFAYQRAYNCVKGPLLSSLTGTPGYSPDGDFGGNIILSSLQSYNMGGCPMNISYLGSPYDEINPRSYPIIIKDIDAANYWFNKGGLGADKGYDTTGNNGFNWYNSTWPFIRLICLNYSPYNVFYNNYAAMDFHISGVRMEDPMDTNGFLIGNVPSPGHYLTNGGQLGFPDTLSGIISSVIIEDVTMSGDPNYPDRINYNHIWALNNVMYPRNFTFKNVKINGNYITSSNYDQYFIFSGLDISFAASDASSAPYNFVFQSDYGGGGGGGGGGGPTGCQASCGPWGPWSDWGPCNSRSRTQIRVRTRSCTAIDCTTYTQREEESRACNPEFDPLGGGSTGCTAFCQPWSAWSDWGVCFRTTRTQIRSRTRVCTDINCNTYTERQEESRSCTPDIILDPNSGCPAACGLWSDWSPWGTCLRNGTQSSYRTRSCTSIDCYTYTETEYRTRNCVYDPQGPGGAGCTPQCGAWGEWTPWSICINNQRVRRRTRSCTAIDCSTYEETETQTEPCDLGPQRFAINIYPNPLLYETGNRNQSLASYSDIQSTAYSVQIFDNIEYKSAFVYKAGHADGIPSFWKFSPYSVYGYGNTADPHNSPGQNDGLSLGITPWDMSSVVKINYLTFGTSATTDVKVIRNAGSITSVDIGPNNKNKQYTIVNNNELVIRGVSPYDKLVVIMNNEVSNALYLFADPLSSTIPQGAIEFGPGIHEMSAINARLGITDSSKNRFRCESNKTYYIHPGAYIVGSFQVRQLSNIKFIGHGILDVHRDNDFWRKWRDPGEIDVLGYQNKLMQTGFFAYSSFDEAWFIQEDTKNIEMSGLTIVNSITAFATCKLKSVDNTKYFGLYFNTDAFNAGDVASIDPDHTTANKNSKHIRSFIFCGDDACYPGKDSQENILFSGNYIIQIGGSTFRVFTPPWNYIGQFGLPARRPYGGFSAIDIDIRSYTTPLYGALGEQFADENDPETAIFSINAGLGADDLALYQVPGQPWGVQSNALAPALFKNIRVEKYCDVPIFMIGQRPYALNKDSVNRQQGLAFGGLASGLIFQNISVSSHPLAKYPWVSSNMIYGTGYEASSRPSNIVFDNVFINGYKLTDSNKDNFFKWKFKSKYPTSANHGWLNQFYGSSVIDLYFYIGDSIADGVSGAARDLSAFRDYSSLSAGVPGCYIYRHTVCNDTTGEFGAFTTPRFEPFRPGKNMNPESAGGLSENNLAADVILFHKLRQISDRDIYVIKLSRGATVAIKSNGGYYWPTAEDWSVSSTNELFDKFKTWITSAKNILRSQYKRVVLKGGVIFLGTNLPDNFLNVQATKQLIDTEVSSLFNKTILTFAASNTYPETTEKRVDTNYANIIWVTPIQGNRTNPTSQLDYYMNNFRSAVSNLKNNFRRADRYDPPTNANLLVDAVHYNTSGFVKIGEDLFNMFKSKTESKTDPRLNPEVNIVFTDTNNLTQGISIGDQFNRTPTPTIPQIHASPQTIDYRSKFDVRVLGASGFLDTYVYSATRQTVCPASGNYLFNSSSLPPMNWVTFGASGPVMVKVQNVSSVEIKPISKAVDYAISSNDLYFYMNPKDKLWLTINNETSCPLFIFADDYKPLIPSSNILYFGPGVSSISTYTVSADDLSIYLDGGSIVKGSFDIRGRSNIRFMGPGILMPMDSSSYESFNSNYFSSTFQEKLNSGYVMIRGSCDDPDLYEGSSFGNSVNGLTIVNNPWYSIFGGINQISNFKQISPWHPETFGPSIVSDYQTKRMSFTDSFIFNGDNCLVDLGRNSGLTSRKSDGNYYANNLFINTTNNSPVAMSYLNYHQSGIQSYTISATDIVIGSYQKPIKDNSNPSSILSIFQIFNCNPNNTNNVSSPDIMSHANITFENVIVDNVIDTPVFRIVNSSSVFDSTRQKFTSGVYGSTKNIVFKNVTASGFASSVSSNSISGLSSDYYNRPHDIIFYNLRINNTAVSPFNYTNYFKFSNTTDPGEIYFPDVEPNIYFSGYI